MEVGLELELHVKLLFQPIMWRICSHFSGGSEATYIVNCENKANSAQLELKLGLNLAKHGSRYKLS